MDGSMHHNDSAAIIAERIAAQGRDWAERESAAQLLEETRKSVRAQVAIENFQEAGSAAKAELLAEASKIYKAHIEAMVKARKEANIARVNYDAGRTWSDHVRTQEANRRAEMQLR